MKVTETAMENGEGHSRLGSGQDHSNAVHWASLVHIDFPDDWLPKLELLLSLHCLCIFDTAGPRIPMSLLHHRCSLANIQLEACSGAPA